MVKTSAWVLSEPDTPNFPITKLRFSFPYWPCF
jgi:hypothetical protein